VGEAGGYDSGLGQNLNSGVTPGTAVSGRSIGIAAADDSFTLLGEVTVPHEVPD
jgi:hypothetical protein